MDEKKALEYLSNQDVEDIKLVGQTIKSAFFKAGETALLIDCASQKAKLFFPIRQTYKREDRIEFAKLVSLLNFIESLEKNGLVYLQPSNAGCELFFYENFDGSFLLGFPKDANTKGVITQQERIVYAIDKNNPQGRKSDILYIKKNDSPIMQSVDVSSLYERIYKFLCCCAFPTTALYRFIDKGYCFDEEKRSIKSLGYARVSFFVAMVALIVSVPPISIWYSNRYSYSTMDTLQYQNLMRKLDAIGKKKNLVTRQAASNTDKNDTTNHLQIQRTYK